MNNTPNSNPFAQVVVDEMAASTSLSESISTQNRVYLDYCQALVDMALNAVESSSQAKGKTNDTSVANKINEEKKNAAKPSSDKTQSTETDAAKNENPTIASDYIEVMNLTMQNALAGQQALNELAIAVTGKLINTIIQHGTDNDK